VFGIPGRSAYMPAIGVLDAEAGSLPLEQAATARPGASSAAGTNGQN